jgi:hypothetical protein
LCEELCGDLVLNEEEVAIAHSHEILTGLHHGERIGNIDTEVWRAHGGDAGGWSALSASVSHEIGSRKGLISNLHSAIFGSPPPHRAQHVEAAGEVHELLPVHSPLHV